MILTKLYLGALVSRGVLMTITPNTNGLPGLNVLQDLGGGLLAAALILAVVALIISTITWMIGHHSGNPHVASRGKTGVLYSFLGSIILGGVNALIAFGTTTGSHI